MFKDNPEFLKNLKLEFNLTRVLVPAVILLLAAWASWTSVQPKSWQTDRPLTFYKAESLYYWMCACGFFFTIVWGTYLSSCSLHEETKQKTWDFVRMSSLSPAKILVGKLLGTTAIVWVLTLAGILPLMTWAGTYLIPAGGGVRPVTTTLITLNLCLIVWAVFSHALALLFALSFSPSNNRSGPFLGTVPAVIGGLWIGGFIINSFEEFYKIYDYNPTYKIPNATLLPDGKYMNLTPSIDWYAFSFYQLDAILLVLSFMTLWAVIGAYRSLRKSLQHKDAPWAWIAFLFSGSLMIQGFIPDEPKMENVLLGPVVMGIATLICTCPNEAGDIIRYKQMRQYLDLKRYADAFKVMPLWLLSFACFVVSVTISIILSGASIMPMLVFISFFGFMIRDIIVLHIIAWTPNIRRPMLAMSIYFGFMYGLLPTIIRLIDKPSADALFPLHDENPKEAYSAAYWIFLCVQIAATVPFFLKRWNGAFGRKQA